MRIKFIEPDPRAGDTVQMDSKRGQQLIDEGAAVRVSEDGSDVVPAAVSGRTALAIALAASLDSALAALPDDYTDPEYVVSGMRSHFGSLFTSEDEATVRAAFPAQASSTGAATHPAPQVEQPEAPLTDAQPAQADAAAGDGSAAPADAAPAGDSAAADDSAAAAKATTAKPKTTTSKK